MNPAAFVNACTPLFNADPALQAHFGTVERFAAARYGQMRAQARQEEQQRVQGGLPAWMTKALAEYAASPTLQGAFGSEKLYLAHLLGERQR